MGVDGLREAVRAAAALLCDPATGLIAVPLLAAGEASKANMDAVRSELVAAGQQGRIGVRRTMVQGRMALMLYVKRSQNIPFLIRAFIASGEREQWFVYPQSNSKRDAAHRAHAVRQAIRDMDLIGIIGFDMPDNNTVHFFLNDIYC